MRRFGWEALKTAEGRGCYQAGPCTRRPYLVLEAQAVRCGPTERDTRAGLGIVVRTGAQRAARSLGREVVIGRNEMSDSAASRP